MTELARIFTVDNLETADLDLDEIDEVLDGPLRKRHGFCTIQGDTDRREFWRSRLDQDIVRIVDQPRNSRVLNTCPSVSIDIPSGNGANVGVDMSCVAADPYRFWFNPPVRISNNSTGAVTRRLISRIACPDLAPSRREMYVKARDFGNR